MGSMFATSCTVTDSTSSKASTTDSRPFTTVDSTSSKTTSPTEQQWECKLCGVKNNSYLSYCEVCLVNQSDQKDESLMQGLRWKLLSGECDDHIKAGDIKGIVKQLCDDLKTLNRIHEDKEIALKIQNEINALFEKNNIQSNPDIVQDFINLYHIDDKKKRFKKQRKMNAKCTPICTCGTEMQRTVSDKCYDPKSYSYVICDVCDHRIKSGETVFHCPRQKVQVHPDGFDICLPCRKKYIHRLRKFVALIICPTMTNGNVDNRDAQTLEKMFTKLGFHEIKCLSNDEVTKHSVQRELQTLSPHNDKNANQLTVICYSGHGELNEEGDYCFSFKNEVLSPMELLKFQCNAARIGVVKDGLKLYCNEYLRNKIYRHNTLMLINSCHAEGVNEIVISQHLADSFAKVMSLRVLGMKLGIDIVMVNGLLTSLASAIGAESKFECMQQCCMGAISLESIACCCGLTVAQFVALAVMTQISLAALIVIVKTPRKSADCESVHVIASCLKKEESSATYGVSPFVRYCNDFFNDFLDGNLPNKEEGRDSPGVLLKYLKRCYRTTDPLIADGVSLEELQQNVCWIGRGFKQFAMCPIFKPHQK